MYRYSSSACFKCTTASLHYSLDYDFYKKPGITKMYQYQIQLTCDYYQDRTFTRFLSFFTVVTTVTSTGLNATSPHCSSFSNCAYTDATKQECAKNLCLANGYNRGAFKSSSNDFCTTSLTESSIWVYALQLSSEYAGRIVKHATRSESQITAACYDEPNLGRI